MILIISILWSSDYSISPQFYDIFR